MKLRRNLIILMAFVISCLWLTGCQTNVDDEETYTVWTDTVTYSSFYSAFNATLKDGYYIRYELSDTQWDSFSDSLTSEGKHVWTKDKIRDWLVGRDFGDSEATKECSWLTTIEHGFIASRSGNYVYFILK